MENFEWQDKFSVHVDEMDRHHKKLLTYFAELQNEIKSGDATLQIGNTLKLLSDYADYHFAEEERLMRAMNYPEITTQINQHAYFTNELKEMNEQFQAGTLPAQSLVSFLRDWFVNHIMQQDKKYGESLKIGKPVNSLS